MRVLLGLSVNFSGIFKLNEKLLYRSKAKKA